MSLRPIALISLLALLFTSTALRAGTIVVDDDTWGWLNNTGTENDPALYVVGPDGPVTVTADVSVTWLGGSYAHLVVQNGSTYNSGGYVYIGQEDGENYNRAHITGNSTWNIAWSLYVGSAGSRNALVVDGGSHVTVAEYDLRIGDEATASHNSVTVSGAGTSLHVAGAVSIEGGGHNSFRIENEASAATDYFTGIGSYSDHNTFIVTGANSRFTSAEAFTIGYQGSHNSLILEDQGLLVIDSYLSINEGSGTSNYLSLNGGFLALAGDQAWFVESLITGGSVRYWDGVSWIVGGLDDFSYGYFDDESAALAFSGYAGLGGYTLLTSPYSAVPEPATYAALAGILVLGLAVRRRRARP